MGKTYNNNEINGEGHVHDLLSAYIDKSLEEPERVRVRAHLEECVDCRADYVELQATTRMLRQMPIASVPRAFTLTPDMVKGATKTSFWERIFAPRTAPTFASGAVVAFGLLLFLFVGSQFSSPSTAPTTATTATQIGPAAPQTLRSSATEDSPAGDTQASMLAEPTTTTADTAANTSGGNDGAANKQAAPTQPVGGAASTNDSTGDAPPAPGGMVLPQPTEAPVEANSNETEPAPMITPNTDIASSVTSSPTTTSYYSETGPGPADVDTQDVTSDSIALQAPTPIVQKFDFFMTVEIALLVIGLALAGAYLVARKR